MFLSDVLHRGMDTVILKQVYVYRRIEQMSKCVDILGASVFTVEGKVIVPEKGKKELHGIGLKLGIAVLTHNFKKLYI